MLNVQRSAMLIVVTASVALAAQLSWADEDAPATPTGFWNWNRELQNSRS